MIALPAIAVAATIGGTYYMPQYDYRDFFAATDHKQFQVILQGDAFPGVNPETVARALLPACAAVGAALCMLADAVCRWIVAPAELPIGVLLAFIGVPAFLYLYLYGERAR